jgi:hypothetical protein
MNSSARWSGQWLVPLMSILSAAGPVFAHHSFAVFDQSKQMTIAGFVKDFQYTNPHSWIDVIVMREHGETEEWGVETGPPNQLRQQGWNKDTIKVGDKVIVVIHPRKDGTKIGSLIYLTMPDGTVIGRHPEPPAPTAKPE